MLWLEKNKGLLQLGRKQGGSQPSGCNSESWIAKVTIGVGERQAGGRHGSIVFSRRAAYSTRKTPHRHEQPQILPHFLKDLRAAQAENLLRGTTNQCPSDNNIV